MVKKQFRFYFFLIQGYFKRHFLFIIISLIATTALLVFLKTNRLQQPVLRIGLIGQYEKTTLPRNISSLISRGLTEIDEKGKILPAVAENWQISEDQKTYTFIIRKNIVWDDGKTVKAKDIRYPYSDLDITTPDDRTLKIQLKEPFSPLLNLLAQPIFKKNFIGIDGYHLKTIQFRGNYIQSLQLISPQKKPKIEFKFYPDEESIRNAFKLGKIDIIWNILHPENLISYPNIKSQSQVSHQQYTAVFLNLNKEKFSEKSVRQALAYTIPKPQGETRAKSPINSNSWAYNDFVKPYELDINHARELLEKTHQEEMTIELATLPNLLDLAEKIKEDWNKIDVQVNIRVVNFIPEDFEALLSTQQIPLDPDQYWFWHSSQQKTNITNLSNPRIDQLLEEGRQVLELKKRREKYLDFQRFLLEESPAIFISHPTYYYICRRGFENYEIPLYNK